MFHFFRTLKILFFCFFIGNAFAFSQRDSLELELEKATEDSTKVDLLLEIGWLMLSDKPEEALACAQKAEPLIKKIQDPYRASNVYRLFAFYYGEINDRPNCLENHMKRVSILESTNENSLELCSAYYETAAILANQGQAESAEAFYLKCNQMALALDHKRYYAFSLLPLAEIKKGRGDIEGCKKDMKLSFNIMKAENSGQSDYILSQFVETLIEQDSLDAASLYAYPPYSIASDSERTDISGYLFSARGHIEYKRGNYKEALYHYTLSQESWEKENSVFYLQELYLRLAQTYAHLRPDSANVYYEKHLALSNQVNTEDNNAKVAEMEARFKNQEKQKEIELLSKENEISGIESKRQSQVNTLISIGLGVVLLFVIFLATRIRIIHKQKNLINEQKEIVESKSREVLDSIIYAKRLQNAILATEDSIKEYFPESFLYYHPKDIVAGDFYFFETTSTHVYYAAADCTGHGVPGAMVSIVCSNALTRTIKEFGLSDPGQILDQTRELVVKTFEKSGQDVKDGMDISLISKNLKTGEIKWAGANNPLWYISNGTLQEIKPDKQPVGKSENANAFTSHAVNEKNAVFYLITDGYADQFGGEKGKKFKASNLKELLTQITSISMDDQKKKLHETFETWRGSLEQLDDVCILGIRV